jgi:nitronate monooxygenase
MTEMELRRGGQMKTRFTDLVGCELPIQLAAMGGGVGTTELAAAVETAGAFGMVSWITEPASGACGMNYLIPFAPSPDAIQEAAKSVRVVEFFYGEPAADLVGSAHSGGALAGWQVGSVAEAVAAAEAGCDYLVAQGIEAGGHVRGKQTLDEILAQVVDAVRIPVLAAGGVATAERVLQLLQSGADGVRIGTRSIIQKSLDDLASGSSGISVK